MSDDLNDQYDEQHAVCPQCGSVDSCETTCVGRGDPPIVDINRATCSDCGWVGIVHDLKPKEPTDDSR